MPGLMTPTDQPRERREAAERAPRRDSEDREPLERAYAHSTHYSASRSRPR
jgi:hypothetical protein